MRNRVKKQDSLGPFRLLFGDIFAVAVIVNRVAPFREKISSVMIRGESSASTTGSSKRPPTTKPHPPHLTKGEFR